MTKRATIGAARLRMSAVLALLALAGGLPALLMHSARAAVIFSTYAGGNCSCGVGGPDFVAAVGFTAGGAYDFAGAAAYVLNSDSAGNPQTFTMALYAASSAGGPASSPLWTSGTLSAPGPLETATLVSASYKGPTILLDSGAEYFLALDMPGPAVAWLGGGSPESPLYYSRDGGPWETAVSASQYEIFGDAPAAAPEPSTWAMMLLGLAGLGYAARRRKAAPSEALAQRERG